MSTGTKGTLGYSEAAERFTEATLSIDFETLHAPFLEFIPSKPARVLDVGAGIGRDASALAEAGHTVVAVEPCAALREASKGRFAHERISWIEDSLPDLARLGASPEPFDFVLASAVWHHLDAVEQVRAVARIARMMAPGSIFALSLRHGPPGVGTHVFPTNGRRTIAWGARYGLTRIVHLTDQASLVPRRTLVTWTKLVFRRRCPSLERGDGPGRPR